MEDEGIIYKAKEIQNKIMDENGVENAINYIENIYENKF